MRTRNLGALTNYEVEKYLEKNDILFIPVGCVELHGPLPMDCEYVAAQCIAMLLAEKFDALVLPYVSYSYPGSTDIGRGTVRLSIEGGIHYLKELLKSLFRQGFRRIVFFSTHEPVYLTVAPVMNEILDEENISMMYSDIMMLFNEAKMSGEYKQFDKMLFGAYKIMGRLEDIPLALDDPKVICKEDSDLSGCVPESAKALGLHGGLHQSFWKFGNVLEHGGNSHVVYTEEERLSLATEGEALIRELVSKVDFSEKLDALKELNVFHKEVVMKTYNSWT